MKRALMPLALFSVSVMQWLPAQGPEADLLEVG